MKCAIRECQKEDARKVAKLIYDTEINPEYEWGRGTEEEHLSRLTDMIIARKNRFSYENIIVAEINGDISGMLLYLEGRKVKTLTLRSDMKLIKYQNDKVMFFINILSYILYRESTWSEMYLSNVCINKEYRGNGFGELLIKRFEITAKKVGYNKVSLRANNNKLASFYERLGYKREDAKSLRMIKKI